jgi:hypothetical protein
LSACGDRVAVPDVATDADDADDDIEPPSVEGAWLEHPARTRTATSSAVPRDGLTRVTLPRRRRAR